MQEIGKDGQEKLAKAQVLVVGAGGLGLPVLTYLACAGVGCLTIVEDDIVEESNLNRQFLYTPADIGKPKGALARERLAALNPAIKVSWIGERLTQANAAPLVSGRDAVVDCVDNIATRLLANDACLRANVPLVEAGIDGFYGYVFPVLRGGACLRCLGYAEIASPKSPGAIGCTAGVIGSLEASVCIRLLLGMPVAPDMLTYDGTRMEFENVRIFRNEGCRHGEG
jgi:adenylyltransferase/sulfurtransferase